MSESYDMGRLGETVTARYLEKQGYKILDRNFRIRGGEIDIIAEKDGIIAFAEVKTRSGNCLSPGEYAVDKRKKQLIIKAAAEYMLKNENDLQPRFDVAAMVFSDGKPLKFNYYPDAFSADGSDIIF